MRLLRSEKMSVKIVSLVCVLLGAIDFGSSYHIKTLEDLRNARGTLLSKEFYRSTGHNVTLNRNESVVNKILMNLKYDEIRQGYLHPDQWVTSNPLSEVLDAINKSKLFGLLKSMPKGGILHAHDSALGSTDTYIKLTYAPFTWICFDGEEKVMFAFSREYPTDLCPDKWQLLEALRECGSFSDDSLINKFSIYGKEFNNTRDVWNHFLNTFENTGNLKNYQPNFVEYVRSYLKECFDDGAQYIEIRSGISEVSFYSGGTLLL